MNIRQTNQIIRLYLIGAFVVAFLIFSLVELLNFDCEIGGDIREERDSIRRELRMREDTIIALDLRMIRMEKDHKKDMERLEAKIKAYEAKIDSVYTYSPTQLDSFFRARYGY